MLRLEDGCEDLVLEEFVAEVVVERGGRGPRGRDRSLTLGEMCSVASEAEETSLSGASAPEAFREVARDEGPPITFFALVSSLGSPTARRDPNAESSRFSCEIVVCSNTFPAGRTSETWDTDVSSDSEILAIFLCVAETLEEGILLDEVLGR